ncbi:MAG: MMPL family transporter [Wenzhouxiangellaceae bacterium]|nr:MMPL family transporter [Wenzhouxiangellaceae bacterium]
MKTLLERLADRSTGFATDRSAIVAWTMTVSTVLLVLMATLPSLWPGTFSPLHPVRVDTDPENMLARDEPVRVFHDKAKRRFNLYDMVVVGIVNETDPDGVFNPETLKRVHALTEHAMTLNYPDPAHPDRRRQVVGVDVIAPSNVDDIQQAGPGQVKFSWLMPTPPETRAEARKILERARRIPMLDGTMTGVDGRALALYLPITTKTISWDVRRDLLEFTADWPAADQVHITGLPVAEDTFGVEMFYQMAISAPLAMLVIFLLMLAFFRNVTLVISPMIVAMVSALSTMALLIITGNTIHIMSSMIPIFIMPIAVLDSVHILSEAFDCYQEYGDRRKTIRAVMRSLFRPMLFTSLTTAVGFASLALTPIPPVQVFGIFVAIGVMLAWLWSILFIPAWVMFIPERSLASFGHAGHEDPGAATWLGRGLRALGRFAVTRRISVLVLAAVLAGVAGWGISLIRINDNPIKWFEPDHPIRVADRVMNDHLAGTYMAYLELEPTSDANIADIRDQVVEALGSKSGGVFEQAASLAGDVQAETIAGYFDALLEAIEEKSMTADDPFAWDDAWMVVDEQRARREIFKSPEVLRWMERLQADLVGDRDVGKVNGVTDIVKTVHRALLGGESEAFRIPDGASTVAQTLLTYQSSHRPQDLWHFVTPDFRSANLWIQLSSGDNRDMERVVARAARFIAANPPPESLRARWFGLTYINVVWQEKMVAGMLWALMGSFAIVLAMMTVLFRSPLWGVVSMVPLTLTVALIYGVIGLIGKDYDMPVAVLSALSLGLAVDFAIHFLARSMQFQSNTGRWSDTVGKLFGEPARAISRNVIILGAGFLPLLAAPLVPYQTVGIFIASIIFAAGVITLVLLPALMSVLQRPLFRKLGKES